MCSTRASVVGCWIVEGMGFHTDYYGFPSPPSSSDVNKRKRLSLDDSNGGYVVTLGEDQDELREDCLLFQHDQCKKRAKCIVRVNTFLKVQGNYRVPSPTRDCAMECD